MLARTMLCVVSVVLMAPGCTKYKPVELSGAGQVEKAAAAYRAYAPSPPRIPKDGPPMITAAEFQRIERA